MLSAGTTATVRFSNYGGGFLGQQSRALGAYGSWTLIGDHNGGAIPAEAHNAEVTASRNLAVMVNNVMPGGSRDKVVDHSAASSLRRAGHRPDVGRRMPVRFRM